MIREPFFHFDENNTFCISLASKPERWQKMQRRFQQCNLTVTQFPAAVGSNPQDITDQFADYLNAGQKGCAQSHINVWRHIQSKPEIPYALVLEDDACFDKEWRTKLEQFPIDMTYDPQRIDTWELILLNASEPIYHREHLWTQVEEQFLTGGYIISQRGIKAILEMFHPLYASSDWMTSRLQTRWNSYCYFPWLIIQEGDESTIGSGVEADHNKVLECLNKIDYSLDNYVIT
jgi:GR25 family glycosyltransferase involved in LPS biosynthesis